MPLQFPDPTEIKRLADALRAASYNSQTLKEFMDLGQGANAHFRDAPSLLYSMHTQPRLRDVCALFQFQLPLSEEAAADALAPANLSALVSAGLLAIHNSSVTARFRIVPCLDTLVVCDLKPIGQALSDDFVMGASASSSVVLNSTIRKHSGRTLDLCSGSGIQAMVAATHSDAIVAVEQNWRAIQLGEFSALLNGRTNVEFRESDFYSAVEGEHFDLIVANPPFVISPGREFQFRDGGLGADRVTAHVVRNAPRFLAEGGMFLTLCDVANFTGTSFEQHVSEWAAGSGCDMAVVRGVSAPMREYPIGWLYDESQHDPAAYLAKFRTWVEYYQREGIESMTACVIVLRRRTSPSNWFHATPEVVDLIRLTGDEVARIFAAVDFLHANPSNADLLSQCLILNEKVRFDQRLVRDGEAWGLRECALALSDEHAKPVPTDPYMGSICSRLNGLTPLGEIINQMAAALRTSADGLAAQIVPVIRGLIERGYVDWK